MSDYKSLSYISKILWHFMGPKPEVNVDVKTLEDPHTLILSRLESMINSKGEITLKRYIQNGGFYKREFEFARVAFMSDWSDLSSLEALNGSYVKPYVVNEPKSLCFCDIPINHLPDHMRKYGDIGLGVRKEVLGSIVDDFFPVHYLPIKNKDDFKKIKGHIRQKKDGEFFLGKYSKIPTEFSIYDNSYTSKSNTETFDQIYEEREWRTFKKIKLSKEQISFILLPNRNIINKGNFPKLKKMINSDVGIIYANELYGA